MGVILFQRQGPFATRFTEGIDIVSTQDIVLLIDQIGKARILYITGAPVQPVSIEGIDLAAEQLISFNGMPLNITQADYVSERTEPDDRIHFGYSEIPGIKEWALLYAAISGSQRKYMVEVFGPNISQLEVYLDKAKESRGLIEIFNQWQRFYLLDEARPEITAWEERITSQPTTLKQLIPLVRASLPYELLMAKVEAFKQKAKQEGRDYWAHPKGIGSIHAEHNLRDIPYEPLESILK
jgi:hypothetical protein